MMSVEQGVIKTLKVLPLEKQQEVLRFVDLQPEEVQPAILRLNRLGFETLSFDFNTSVS